MMLLKSDYNRCELKHLQKGKKTANVPERMGKKTANGDAAKELWRMDAQRTAKVLRTVSAEWMKARQELRFLRVCVSVKRSRVASSQQIVDDG